MSKKPVTAKVGEPLPRPALVKFKVKFRAGNGVTYEPRRFGVEVPAGLSLPKTAIILDDDYGGEDLAGPPSAKSADFSDPNQVKFDL